MKRALGCLCLLLALPCVAVAAEPSEQRDLTAPIVVAPRWRFRFAAELAGGGYFSDGAGAGAVALRFGAERRHVALFVDVVLLGGYVRLVSDPNDTRVALLFMGYVRPTVEIDIARHGFVSASLVLGAGSFAQTKHRVAADGTVRSDSLNLRGSVASFIPGIATRAGWRFGNGEHRVTTALDLQLLVADGHRATASYAPSGAYSARDRRQAALAGTALFVVAYDFRK